ncbi:hypothetical protein FVEG_14561 [Fusarium verticillioides 7600]|uniref:Uncharacterized protein n=1 Tax=Gibberella moniliformis (strain M3125 / FGSC 7600) TaxID=334819 RepID=W7LAS9_GIBM7|nr:hypothetical protein FVEG_14561 [Fusarium verticillioides 7600]EWG35781.1 hypothetical protein FVEG_14561 [Fusarium verticillioides 7600]
MAKSLWIAWEFGLKDPFCRLARRMLMESDGSEDRHLKMQPDIIGKFPTNITSTITNSVLERISPNRFTTIQALLDIIRKLINDLLVVDEKPRWCRHAEWMGPHRCESMIFNVLSRARGLMAFTTGRRCHGQHRWTASQDDTAGDP